jgi:hypothetical protein
MGIQPDLDRKAVKRAGRREKASYLCRLGNGRVHPDKSATVQAHLTMQLSVQKQHAVGAGVLRSDIPSMASRDELGKVADQRASIDLHRRRRIAWFGEPDEPTERPVRTAVRIRHECAGRAVCGRRALQEQA